MSFICTDNGCINLNVEEGSEEWRYELRQQGVSEEDIKKLDRFVKEIKNQ